MGRWAVNILDNQNILNLSTKNNRWSLLLLTVFVPTDAHVNRETHNYLFYKKFQFERTENLKSKINAPTIIEISVQVIFFSRRFYMYSFSVLQTEQNVRREFELGGI